MTETIKLYLISELEPEEGLYYWKAADTTGPIIIASKIRLAFKMDQSYDVTGTMEKNHFLATKMETSKPPKKTEPELKKVETERQALELEPEPEFVPASTLITKTQPSFPTKGDVRTEIVVKPEDNIYEVSERQDEIQMADELKGKVVEVYFYQFDQWDQAKRKKVKQTGISYAGVKKVINQMGNVHILTEEDKWVEYDERRKLWVSRIKVRDVKKNLDSIGIASCKEEAYNMEFADRIALSKALRNAWRRLIDEALIVEMGKEWLAKRQKR